MPQSKNAQAPGGTSSSRPGLKMKLFSLLMGNSSPVGPGDESETAEVAAAPDLQPPDSEAAVTPAPHVSLNLDRLKRIFQALSRANDQSTEGETSEVDEEPMRMRRKYLGIFDRKFGPKSSSSKPRTKHLKIPREKLLALLSRRNSGTGDKSKPNWARSNLNKLTSSMRHVKSDSFLARHISARRRNREAVDSEEQGTELRLPIMKTKKRSTVERSRALINSASITAHKDLISNLEKNSSQHCLDDIDFRNYDYPFENFVFEGGGAKVHTYIGAIKCIEEAGIKPKRLAGTSAGAITAGLLAVGYTSEEIHILYEYDVEYNVKDGTCGLLSLLPNMFRHYGWNPGERAMRWYGECLAVKTGNPDITFRQVYDEYGVELCIVAVNLSNRCEEYFHPKTTPDMPIKLATRMSSSLPGYFQPVRQGNNVYVDGGLLCNYPLHVFDGWWLSMDPDDVFYKKMGSLENLPKIMERKNRFGKTNEKTLGFCMFSMFDDKALRYELEKRHKLTVTKRPKTKLAMKRMKQMKVRAERQETRETTLDALSRFFRVLTRVHLVSGELKKDALIKEFDRLLADDEKATSSIEECSPESTPEKDKDIFTRAHVECIFGENSDLRQMIRTINADQNGVVSSIELIIFLKRNNVDIQETVGNQFVGKGEISNFGSFFMTVQESLMNSARRVYIQADDLDRTVGINTDYVKMDDFRMDREDQEFLIQQGYKSTAAFLRYWIHQHNKLQISSQPLSEASDLSDLSDCSPVHSSGELSDTGDNPHERDSESPVKSTGSQTTSSVDSGAVGEDYASPDNTGTEEIIIAEVELTPESQSPDSVSRSDSLDHIIADPVTDSVRLRVSDPINEEEVIRCICAATDAIEVLDN